VGANACTVHIDKVKGLVHRADALLEQIRSWLPDHRVYPISETREGPPNSSEATSRPLELIYHVSISRTVGVRQHQIEPLIDLLRSSLATAPRWKDLLLFLLALSLLRVVDCAMVSSFEASFGAEYEVFTNDEHTRSFFSLSIIEGKEKVRHRARHLGPFWVSPLSGAGVLAHQPSGCSV